MLGWLADLFRFPWALVYWNTRKTWFRAGRGQRRCPCQSPSDSGKGYETGCEACLTWAKPARFRRVCPLLVDTPEGLRCSVDTPQVRPFWGRAFLFFGGSVLAVYAAAVLTVFIFLRSVGYPISIVHVGLPPLWHKVGQARGWFFLDRADRAFAEGKTAEGLLYLANGYDFDPANYGAGLRLAKHYQAGHADKSDQVFQRLLNDHPEKRITTWREWFRALQPRGDFPRIAAIARDALMDDAERAGAWMQALVFASRRLDDDAVLRGLLSEQKPAAAVWRPLLEAELLLRAGKLREVRAALERPWPANAPAFTLYYRVSTLLDLREPMAARDVLDRHPGVDLGDARISLGWRAYAEAGAMQPLRIESESLLSQRLNAATVIFFCGHLIRNPDTALFERLWARLEREPLPLSTENAGAWFSLFAAAGAGNQRTRLQELGTRLKNASSTPFVALGLVEAFFRGETPDRRVTSFLPILPLPIEINYALIDRYEPSRFTPGTAKRP